MGRASWPAPCAVVSQGPGAGIARKVHGGPSSSAHTALCRAAGTATEPHESSRSFLSPTKATVSAPVWALLAVTASTWSWVSVIIRSQPTSSRMVTTVTSDRLDGSNSWWSGGQVRLPWQGHVRAQLPSQNWALTFETIPVTVLKPESPACPGLTGPPKDPPQLRKEELLPAHPQLPETGPPAGSHPLCRHPRWEGPGTLSSAQGP